MYLTLQLIHLPSTEASSGMILVEGGCEEAII